MWTILNGFRKFQNNRFMIVLKQNLELNCIAILYEKRNGVFVKFATGLSTSTLEEQMNRYKGRYNE